MDKEYKEYTVFIVEDEPDILELLTGELKDINNIKTVITAKDGVEATQKLRNQEFDLVILDYKIPKRDGIEILQAFKKEFENNKTKVILISGQLDPSALKEAVKLGVHKVLIKPFTDDEFMAEVAKIIDLDFS